MTQSDYIMRMVEQLARVLQQIISKRESREYASAYEILNEAYQSLTGLKAKFVHQLSDHQLISLLDSGTQSGNEQLIALAELLFEEATLAEELNDARYEANSLRVKSLSLFLQVVNQSEYWQSDEYVLKIKEISQMVDLKMIPVQTLEKLMVFYKTLSASKDMQSVQSELMRRNVW